MTDPVSVVLFLLGLAQARGGGAAPPAPDLPPPPPPPQPQRPAPAPFVAPPAPMPPPPPAPSPTVVVPTAPPPPTAAPTMPPWPAGPVPAELPPFPGPGWVADTPVSAAVVARAQYWNPLLWNFPTKTIVKPFVQEQFGGRWMTFRAAWHPGPSGPQSLMATEAFRLANAQPAPASPTVPQPPHPPPPGPIVVPQAAVTPVPPISPVTPHPAAPTPPPTPSSAGYPAATAPAVTPSGVTMTPKQIQHALNTLAMNAGVPAFPYPLVEDGDLGAVLSASDIQKALTHTLSPTHHLSRQAIALFQKANGLRIDSDPGPQTQTVLQAHVAAMGLGPVAV